MSSKSSDIENELEHDQRLADLLESLVKQNQEGRLPELEIVARAHPEFARELRQLWATIQFTQEFAHCLERHAENTTWQKDLLVGLPTNEDEQTLPLGNPVPRLPFDFAGYELIEELGKGGMGAVYKAKDKRLNRTVALKLILRGQSATPEQVSRFRAEARAAGQLDHSNIVPVYDSGEVQHLPYFVMKYIDGSTLSTVLENGPLPPRDAARLLLTICRAVAFAHDHGLLHRDLKPSNIIIDRTGQPFVTDFGLVKDLSHQNDSVNSRDLTRSGTILGTPAYMAPEQAFGGSQDLTAACDVYSLGVILYEMVTGRPPFRAASSGDTLLLVREQEPVPPSFLNPKVENDLELICLQCLQKHPDHRYRSAAKLAGDLEAFLAGDSPSVRSGSLIDYVSRLMRDTHHVGVLENWGLLWMWHSLKVFLLCAMTNALAWFAVASPWPYVLLWSLGLVIWGAIFWALRRRGGPVMFVERQIAHVWAASVIATICVFLVEVMLGLEPLKLSPILAAIAGMVFVIKGGMLSGRFYVAAFALFATIPLMVWLAPVGQLILGAVSALCFFIPGLFYYRHRRKAALVSSPQTPISPAPPVPELVPSTGGPSARRS